MATLKESAEVYAREAFAPDKPEFNLSVNAHLAGAKAALEMAAKGVERNKRVQGLARVTLAAQIRALLPQE